MAANNLGMMMGLGASYQRTVRKLMPLIPGTYAGMEAVIGKRLGDDLLSRAFGKPFGYEDDPYYELGLAQGLAAFVRPGDRVVVVGGGFGVTAALAASRAGPSGHVICFEGSATQVAAVRDTARRNGVNVLVEHAFVGSGRHVYGSTGGATNLSALDLPDCDVLEMDCEGSELEIIRSMCIRPRTILVETHGVYGSPTAEVADALRQIDYEVDERQLPIGAGVADFCAENDIYVLFAQNRAQR